MELIKEEIFLKDNIYLIRWRYGMAIKFPIDIDDFANPTALTPLNKPGMRHHEQHGQLNDAVEAIETKVGANLSDVNTSLDYIANLFLITATQNPKGNFAEKMSVSGSVLPQLITWYTDASKTIKLVDKQFTYGTPKPVPTQIIMRLYDGTASNLIVRTITDTITYTNIFETSRSRSIS